MTHPIRREWAAREKSPERGQRSGIRAVSENLMLARLRFPSMWAKLTVILNVYRETMNYEKWTLTDKMRCFIRKIILTYL